MSFNVNEIKQYYLRAAEFFARKDFESAYHLFTKLDKEFNILSSKGEAIRKKLAPIANRVKQNLAETAFETGRAQEAYECYIILNKKIQAAYIAIFLQKPELALKLCECQPISPGSKWVKFIACLFQRNLSALPNPGYLVFRLYLETTARYCLMYRCKGYLAILHETRPDLEKIYPEYRKSIASAFLALDNYSAAVELLEDAKRFEPNDAEIYFKLGKSYLAINSKKHAVQNFTKALQLMPGHMASERYLKLLNP